MGSQVFDVDLLAFERGNDAERKSVVNGVMRSLETGFVYSAHDISQNFLDDVYGKLDEFFALAPDLKRTAVDGLLEYPFPSSAFLSSQVYRI